MGSFVNQGLSEIQGHCGTFSLPLQHQSRRPRWIMVPLSSWRHRSSSLPPDHALTALSPNQETGIFCVITWWSRVNSVPARPFRWICLFPCCYGFACCLGYSSFFKTGDYQSAVNVYSHAIRLNPKLYSYPFLSLAEKLSNNGKFRNFGMLNSTPNTACGLVLVRCHILMPHPMTMSLVIFFHWLVATVSNNRKANTAHTKCKWHSWIRTTNPETASPA